MNYALIENGVVVNVIVIYEGNAAEFASAVPLQDVPVQIGDAYADGRFYRNGVPLYSQLEQGQYNHCGSGRRGG